MARPGGRIGDIAHAVGIVGRSAGYGIPALGGHRLGCRGNELPFAPHEGTAGRGTPLRPGMALAVGPLFSSGGSDHVHTPDGWTVRTDDDSRAAHVEHTVAITEDGPQVLTRP